jgi:hypothetical protein
VKDWLLYLFGPSEPLLGGRILILDQRRRPEHRDDQVRKMATFLRLGLRGPVIVTTVTKLTAPSQLGVQVIRSDCQGPGRFGSSDYQVGERVRERACASPSFVDST